MPTYPVNPADPTSPTDQQGAKQGAEEFRALKALIASMIVANSASSGPRQAIQSAVLDANGYNNALTVGAGLRPGLTASAVDPLHLSIANGFTGGKAINSDESIVANVADILGVDLPTSNTSYLYRNYGADYNSTLIPPQYGYAFDRTKGALLNFDGINGAVTTTDDFGNTWTFAGNAAISTTQFKFGTSSLLLDGAGDFISSVNFTSLGDGSWEIAGWGRTTNNAIAIQTFFNAYNAGTWGIHVYVNAAGKVVLSASSNGTSYDIVNASAGATTLAINTWYKIRTVFDALAGTLRVYLSNNGAAETQEITVATTSKICAITAFRIGSDSTGAGNSWNGWIDAFRFLPCATATSTQVPAAVAPTIADYKVTYFSIPQMKMYEVTVASGAAGVNPTLTAVVRLFLGEADTSGAAVIAVRNYAIRGEFFGEQLAPLTAATAYSFNDNIGTKFKSVESWIECVTAENGWKVGERQLTISDGNAGTGAVLAGQTIDTVSRNVSRLFTHINLMAADYTNGNTQFSPALAKWKAGVRIRRSF